MKRYITFYLFDGTTDIYNQMAASMDNFKELITLGSVENGFDWFFMIALAFIAIFLLPRQFQVSVLENTREKHLKKAIWLFPLYLLLNGLTSLRIYILWTSFTYNLTTLCLC